MLTDREIGETVHTMNKLSFSFRLIVLRWRAGQMDLFSDGYYYHSILTDLDAPAEEVVWQYNDRAQIENVIKELKNGFGMEYMPTGDFGANSFWFSLGVLAYNVFVMKKYFVLPEALRAKTIQSIIGVPKKIQRFFGVYCWMLVEAGKVVKHARGLCLKVYTEVEKFILYKKIRLRFLALAG